MSPQGDAFLRCSTFRRSHVTNADMRRQPHIENTFSKPLTCGCFYMHDEHLEYMYAEWDIKHSCNTPKLKKK